MVTIQGNVCLHQAINIAKMKRKESFLESALEHANQNPAGEFMFLPTSDPKVLIADIEEYLADYDNDNQTLIESLEKILNQLKSIS